MAQSPASSVQKAIEFVSISLQAHVVVPITIKQYGAVSLTPILREVNEDLLVDLLHHGFTVEQIRKIRVTTHTCQSLPLTSTLHNILRHTLP